MVTPGVRATDFVHELFCGRHPLGRAASLLACITRVYTKWFGEPVVRTTAFVHELFCGRRVSGAPLLACIAPGHTKWFGKPVVRTTAFVHKKKVLRPRDRPVRNSPGKEPPKAVAHRTSSLHKVGNRAFGPSLSRGAFSCS